MEADFAAEHAEKIVGPDQPRELYLDAMRHSAAHVMAEAVLSIFPEAKLGIGPTIQDGFYYDFQLPRPLTPEDLARIEDEMRRVVALDAPFVRNELHETEAKQLFVDQPYKLEIIEEIPASEPLSTFAQDSFVDLCRGPHVPSTGHIGAFKLLSVAGAYWRGDERRPMLQRIYGTAWPAQEELDAYLHRLEEASRRDHRRLGKELGMFSVHEEVGPGLIFWHPRGAMVRHLIETWWWQEHIKRGYQPVYTPHIASESLYQISGHLANYGDLMYSAMDIEGEPYRVKPMNCPGHIMIYKSQLWSYRDLPIRYAELGTVYRYERSGVLHGLLRVRGFTQDDAHIFCTPEQLTDEIAGVIDLVDYVMSTFGYSYRAYLATRPAKAIGEPEVWERATANLIEALGRKDLAYEVDEGGGAFYGPKIDFKLFDALGREWQGPTIQVDFNLPELFDLTFVGEDGNRHRTVMIHRAVLGSMERFVGGLLEHYGGALPLWLSPVQARLVPIADRHLEYARQVEQRLRAAGLRADTDARRERMNHKIRDAQVEKIPYMLIVGDKEVESGTASVRQRTGQDLGARTIDDLIADLQEQVARKE